MAARDRRRAELAGIHLGAKVLGWDEEFYRGVLEQLTGKRSAAALSEAERARVLDFMRARGFKRADGTTDTPAGGDRQATMRPQLALIRSYWTALGIAGALRETDEAGLRKFVRRMTGVAALEWLTPAQASKVIEGLKAWIARHERQQAQDGAQ